MAGQNIVTFKGSLMAGPAKATSCAFPAGVTNVGFGLKPDAKPAPVMTSNVRNLQSPSGFATLHGIGSGEDVTMANFLFLRTDGPIEFRITADDGIGGNVVAVVAVDGLLAVEKPAGKHIKLLEAQGTGVVEYFASGTQ